MRKLNCWEFFLLPCYCGLVSLFVLSKEQSIAEKEHIFCFFKDFSAQLCLLRPVQYVVVNVQGGKVMVPAN